MGGCCEARSLCAWLSLVMADAPESMWTEPTGVGCREGNSGSTEVIWLHTAARLKDTHDLPADPVVGVVEGVAFPLKQLGEQGAQVFVVGLFEEVQAPHVSQVGGHLLCTTAGQTQDLKQSGIWKHRLMQWSFFLLTLCIDSRSRDPDNEQTDENKK